MNRQMIALGMGVALVLGSQVACVNREAQKQASRTKAITSDPTTLVQVEVVRQATVREVIEITGTITTADDTVVGAKIGGRLVGVYVKDGDPVRAGQVIAQQESTDAMLRVRQAQAGVDGARAALQQARADASVGPRKSAAAVESAKAKLKQAKAQLEKMRKGARDEVRRQTKTMVESARSNMETARKELERVQTLFGEGAVSKADLDRAQNAYQAALSQYERSLEDWRMVESGERPEDITTAEANVRSSEQQLLVDQANQKLDVVFQQRVEAASANFRAAQETLAMARKSQDDTSIRSPFTGKIAGKPAQVGTVVNAGAPVARVVGTAGVYFEGQIPESSVARLRPGIVVEVTIDAFKGERFYGTVEAINPLGSEFARLYNARVRVGGDLSRLKPGMFVRGQVELSRVNSATVVPTTSILKEGNNHFVFLFESGKARKVKVTPGLENGPITQVQGVLPGQKVITKGQSNLVDGSPVRIEEPKIPSSDLPSSKSRGS